MVDLTIIASCYGLNSSQAGTFAKIVATRPIGLLQGPPGTGRTKFIAALVHFFNTDWRYPYHQALALIGMGETDRAIEALEKMAPSGPVRVGVALAVPELDPVRDDPRLEALRRDVALLQ